MPRDGSYYLPQFAHLLKQVRTESGMTVRELAQSMHYSHPYVVRATTGERLPRWPLVSAYLNACGVGGSVLYAWRKLWSLTSDVEQKQCLPAGTGRTEQSYWELVEHEWQLGLLAIRRPDPILNTVRMVRTMEELGIAIHALVTRAGLDSIRKVEAETGIPKTTLHHWFNGTRRPDPARLWTLVTALQATEAEQREFATALKRISDPTCEDWSYRTGYHCLLVEFHSGPHRATDGEEWLDDGVLDGPSGPRDRFSKSTGSAGPHW